jgi:hypothetical protein
MSFARAARRLAGLAGVLLGWRPQDFWNATPDELAAIIEGHTPHQGERADRALLERLKEIYPDG